MFALMLSSNHGNAPALPPVGLDNSENQQVLPADSPHPDPPDPMGKGGKCGTD
jgi:hypothetical protein